MPTTVLARTLPYRAAARATERVCTRCGIQYRIHHPKRDGIHTECRDCREIE